jgi:hypothetical protein
MKDVQEMPPANNGSHHNLLVAKICTRMNKIVSSKKETKMECGEVICSIT